MARLIWSPQAAADLQGICEFIARDCEEYARITASRIVAAAEGISERPRSGRIVPEMEDPHIREKILGNYRLIYRLKHEAVEIVTVIHGARLLDTDILEEEL
jgi:plasmid stabilization system protein ParE